MSGDDPGVSWGWLQLPLIVAGVTMVMLKHKTPLKKPTLKESPKNKGSKLLP